MHLHTIGIFKFFLFSFWWQSFFSKSKTLILSEKSICGSKVCVYKELNQLK